MTKKKKILNIVANIFVAVILIVVLFVTISTLTSQGKGYNSMFGHAYMTVNEESDSMNGENKYASQGKKDGFTNKDLIFFNLLDADEMSQLEEGDIIAFYYGTTPNGDRRVVTHRIVAIEEHNIYNPETMQPTGEKHFYITTKGDNIKNILTESFYSEDVIGLYTGKWTGFGSVIKFFNSQWGFFGLIVVPSFLVVLYFGYELVVAIRESKYGTKEEREQKAKEKEAELRAQLKAELLEELKKEDKKEE